MLPPHFNLTYHSFKWESEVYITQLHNNLPKNASCFCCAVHQPFVPPFLVQHVIIPYLARLCISSALATSSSNKSACKSLTASSIYFSSIRSNEPLGSPTYSLYVAETAHQNTGLSQVFSDLPLCSIYGHTFYTDRLHI